MDPEYRKILRAMTPAQKLDAVVSLQESARRLKADALRSMNPDWPEEKVLAKVREIFLYS